jgi:hypothetical protein
MINDNSEYITDKYARTGYLINIGDYYLFQPSELNYGKISMHDRSVPLDFKHDNIKFEIKGNATRTVIDKRGFQAEDIRTRPEKGLRPEEKVFNPIKMGDARERERERETVLRQKIITEIFENYKLALSSSSIEKGDNNWYKYCGIVIRKMKEEGIDLDLLELFLIEHIIDSLMMDERIDVLNYVYSGKSLDIAFPGDAMFKRFIPKVKTYLMSKVVVGKGVTGILMFDGPSRVENVHMFVLRNDSWHAAEPEDKIRLKDPILQKYRLKSNLHNYVGFIGFETNKKYMVYKVKDTLNKRSTGFRCDQAGKKKTVAILDDIESETKEKDIRDIRDTKDSAFELCVRQEFTLRYYELNNEKGKTWYLDTETAIINEFEKREK